MPSLSSTAGTFGETYLGGIGVIWDTFVAGGLEKAAPGIYTCLRCGRCVERCAMQINVPVMIGELRNRLTSGQVME